MASIYVISRQSGAIKVGISGNVRGRLSTLRTASHEPLMRGDAHVGDGAAALERAVHEALEHPGGKPSGEWFKVTPNTAIAAMAEAAGRLAPLRAEPISRARKRRLQSVQFAARVGADFSAKTPGDRQKIRAHLGGNASSCRSAALRNAIKR